MTKPDKKQENPEVQSPAQEAAEIPQDVKKQAEAATGKDSVETLQAQIDELKGALMRALADLENQRKRTQKEVEDANKYGVSTFAKDLLNVSENLQRAIDAAPAEQKELFLGVELTQKELHQVFERRGIKRVDPKPGEKFDHNQHQAIAQVEDPKFEQGAIIQVVQAGYIMHDRLLRPAMVTVSKGIVKTQGDQPKVDTTA